MSSDWLVRWFDDFLYNYSTKYKSILLKIGCFVRFFYTNILSHLICVVFVLPFCKETTFACARDDLCIARRTLHSVRRTLSLNTVINVIKKRCSLHICCLPGLPSNHVVRTSFPVVFCVLITVQMGNVLYPQVGKWRWYFYLDLHDL